MALPGPDDLDHARQARKVAVTLVVTMGLWLGGQNLGATLGWDGRIALLMDFAAMAAFGWALVGTYRIWRKRREN